MVLNLTYGATMDILESSESSRGRHPQSNGRQDDAGYNCGIAYSTTHMAV